MTKFIVEIVAVALLLIAILITGWIFLHHPVYAFAAATLGIYVLLVSMYNIVASRSRWPKIDMWATLSRWTPL